MIEGSLIQWLNQVLVSKSKKANYIIIQTQATMI